MSDAIVLGLNRRGRPSILTHCHRCDRRYRGRGDWNVEFKAGVAQWLLCPACQTPDENLEAQVNEATLDLRHHHRRQPGPGLRQAEDAVMTWELVVTQLGVLAYLAFIIWVMNRR